MEPMKELEDKDANTQFDTSQIPFALSPAHTEFYFACLIQAFDWPTKSVELSI